MPPPVSTAHAGPGPAGERWTRLARRMENAFGLVLLLVTASYVLFSVVSYRSWGAVAITALAATSATVALTTAEASRPVVRWAGRFSVLAVLLAGSAAAGAPKSLLGLSALILMFLMSAAGASVLRAVIAESEVGFRTILGAVSVFVLLSLLFAFLYAGLDRLQSGYFFAGNPKVGSGDFVFFSITTLTTTGYGDLVPAAQPGKMFSGLEMLTGQIFLVTLIAGLVSMWKPGEWVRLHRR